ncbi:hypothetical protein T484DRAFT_1852056 [Baffinella frigidus]|nr:hypothetical protein T484DRAFT_1852056 [Cryptophyta sp. CCMP2293]
MASSSSCPPDTADLPCSPGVKRSRDKSRDKFAGERLVCCKHGVPTSAVPHNKHYRVACRQGPDPDSFTGLSIQLGERGIYPEATDCTQTELAELLAQHKDNDMHADSYGTCRWRGKELDLPAHLASECAFEKVICAEDEDAGSCKRGMQRHFAERHASQDCTLRAKLSLKQTFKWDVFEQDEAVGGGAWSMTRFFSRKLGGAFNTFHDWGSMDDPYDALHHTVMFNTQAWTRCAIRMEVSLLDKQGGVVRVVSDDARSGGDLEAGPSDLLEVPGVYRDTGPYLTFALTPDDTARAVTTDDHGKHFTLFATVEVVRRGKAIGGGAAAAIGGGAAAVAVGEGAAVAVGEGAAVAVGEGAAVAVGEGAAVAVGEGVA